ncbi:DNA (cytosine-5-)-methyltransferase [Candidatus Saccharibacteria bacterium RIFCSPHIGHO2_02_FULL_47_12]|nr:MAG: DNA (cytosine-5-)-methyltransferase [Candidatus Saccharibacteria bacterium RIFCSPHIGHO2_02_FULL_47_12]
MLKSNKNIKVIDLFSGIGGLTYGFKSAGLNVVAGIDNDSTCKYGYETSNKTRFILKDINDVSSEELEELYKDSDIKVLAGCAPCQPYSKLNQKGATDQKMMPLKKFALLIREIKPDIVSMENVGGLVNKDKYPVFADFLAVLDELGYYYDYKVINTADYGVPQSRKRLVLLASRLGPISVPKPTHEKHITLREIIGDLPKIEDGIIYSDPLHYARKLSPLNKKRIEATPKDGGTQKSWPDELILDCHKKESGKSFGSVYGRMWWDKPASTMTTQCIGIGNGRFGHPEQDRAISLREAARIQTFPDDYVFFDDNEEMTIGAIAKFIGNAVPVRLGEVLGTTIQEHVNCRL